MKEFIPQIDQGPQLPLIKYPAEIRKLGVRAMVIFDDLYRKNLEKGHAEAEAYYHAASRAPEIHRAELRHSPVRLDPL
jgi:hypothetical protein